VAQAYAELGFNVAVIDADGTANAQKDVAHSLACDVMQVENCVNGRVIGLESETVDVASTRREIDELTVQQRQDLEALFLMRDCYYWLRLLSNPAYSTVNGRNIGSTCAARHMEIYEQLVDTDFFINAIRAQLDCATEDVDLNSLLLGAISSGSSAGSIDTVGLIIVSIAVLIVVSLVVMYVVVQKTRRSLASKAQVRAPAPGVFRDTPPSESSIQPYSDKDDCQTQGPYSDTSSSAVDDNNDFKEEAVFA
jgi:hypothetical protein